MKQLILLSTLFLLFSCSSDDSSSVNNPTNSFNPPAWIQGTWLYTVDGITGSTGYRFKPNDFCALSSISEGCLSGQPYIEINEEIISDDEYKFQYGYGGTTHYFHFKKTSSNNMVFIDELSGTEVTFIKQ